jgi:hypothetical protein
LLVERLVAGRIHVVGIEFPDVREQCLGQLAPLDVVVGKRVTHLEMQFAERRYASDDRARR